MTEPSLRALQPSDWAAVRAIYAEGIATRQATFETELPSWEAWDAAHHRFARLVADDASGLVGWGALSPVSKRACYAGVAEVSVYVAEKARSRRIGRMLLEALIRESEANDIWTLQGSTFPENAASLRLQERCGFRIVGWRERVAKLDGVWRDTVLTERRSPGVGKD